jgi:hypothetical protein
MTENKKMPADFATEICRHLLFLMIAGRLFPSVNNQQEPTLLMRP